MTDGDILEALRSRGQARRALPPVEIRRPIRKAAGVRTAEMAEIVGVTRQAVDFWERGLRTPTGERLEKYVAALRACQGNG